MSDEREPTHGVSTWALDLYFADAAPQHGPIHDHLAGCASCRAYLAELQRLADEGAPEFVPPARVTTHSFARRRIVVAGALAMAASVGLVWSATREREPDVAYVGTKGTPSAQVLVRRHEKTEIWDGRAPITSGDSLAVRVACEGYGEVAVAAPSASAGGKWSRLFESPCPKEKGPLPFTLVADDAPGDERFAVVFSRVRLADEALASAAARGDRTAEAWSIQITIPKQSEKR